MRANRGGATGTLLTFRISVAAILPRTMFSRLRGDQGHQGTRSGKRLFLETSAQVIGVIVADDDPMIRSVLRAALESIDVNVFVAADGLEAVELASRVQAALIILDLKMPRLNGLLACQRIRQLPGKAQTPIVILTAALERDAKTVAETVGATEYFMKPFRPALMLQALSRFLPINDAQRDLIRRNADRANGIARAVPTSIGDVMVWKPGPDSLLDRGRNILEVLRG